MEKHAWQKDITLTYDAVSDEAFQSPLDDFGPGYFGEPFSRTPHSCPATVAILGGCTWT